jgi:hypothetical protein
MGKINSIIKELDRNYRSLEGAGAASVEDPLSPNVSGIWVQETNFTLVRSK